MGDGPGLRQQRRSCAAVLRYPEKDSLALIRQRYVERTVIGAALHDIPVRLQQRNRLSRTSILGQAKERLRRWRRGADSSVEPIEMLGVEGPPLGDIVSARQN